MTAWCHVCTGDQGLDLNLLSAFLCSPESLPHPRVLAWDCPGEALQPPPALQYAAQHCLETCCPGTGPAPGQTGPALSLKLLCSSRTWPSPFLSSQPQGVASGPSCASSAVIASWWWGERGIVGGVFHQHTGQLSPLPLSRCLLPFVAKPFVTCRSAVSRTTWISKTQVDWALVPLFTCLHVQGPAPRVRCQDAPSTWTHCLLSVQLSPHHVPLLVLLAASTSPRPWLQRVPVLSW